MIKESDECLVAEAPKDVTETENVDKFCPDKKYSTVVEELNNLKLNLISMNLNERKTSKMKIKRQYRKVVKNEPKFLRKFKF